MAVYTTLTHDDITELLSRYDVGTLSSFEGISEGVSNTNYLLSVIPVQAGIHSRSDPRLRGGVNYILTLFEKHYKLEELPYFSALMQWLHARGIHCPQPITMRDGRVLGVIKDKPAIMVSFLEGAGVKPGNITTQHVQQLGALAAQMHVAGMGFPHERKNGMLLGMWEKLIDKNLDRFDEIQPGLRKLVAEEYNHLSEHWPSALPSGPIHADLFPDNVFFQKNTLSGVIDFYFACNDFWAYDLAIIVGAWCFNGKGNLMPERVAALMAGYNDIRPMTPEEEAAFPLLLRGAALRFLLTRADAWLNPTKDAEVTTKDPLEYVAKLKLFQGNGDKR